VNIKVYPKIKTITDYGQIEKTTKVIIYHRARKNARNSY